MRLAFAIFLSVHGLIHLLGFVKAFGYAQLPQLSRAISAATGVLWLVSAGLFVLAAALLFVAPRWWWAIGALALVVSTIAIVPSWSDARFGAAANLVVLIGVVFGLFVDGPASLRAAYDRDVAGRLTAAPSPGVVSEDDLAALPAPVQRYLRATGVVGQPRVHNFRARMHGRIRGGPDDRWMPYTAEQHNFYGVPARLFRMDAAMRAVPVQVFHRYADGAASMRVRVAGLVPMVDLSGSEMTRAETVTLLNDMCVFAPATLVEPSVEWEPLDEHRARARYTNAGHAVSAVLLFNAAGELTDFVSDDRLRASPDGRTMTAARWSTPLGDYRSFGAFRLASRGEGRWHDEGGGYAYLEVHLDAVEYNVTAR